MWSSPVVKPVALFNDSNNNNKNNNSFGNDKQKSLADESKPIQKQDLASWKAKRDRWMGSPRPRLKPLPASASTTKSTADYDSTSISPKSLSFTKPSSTDDSLPSTLGSLSLQTTKATTTTTTAVANESAKTTKNPFGAIHLVASSSSSSTQSNSTESNTKPKNPFGSINLVPSTTETTTTTTAPTFGSTSATLTSSTSKNPFGTVSSSKPLFGTTSISTSTTPSTTLASTLSSKPQPNKAANPFAGLNLVPSSKPPTTNNTAVTQSPTVPSKPSNPFGGTHLVASWKLLSTQPKSTETNKPSASASSSSSSYPPMSGAAPKNPFGAKTTEKTTKSTTSSSSTYPPMSSAAPKNPFGAKTIEKTTKPTASSSSSYPPMASAAPKNPFASGAAPKKPDGTKAPNGFFNANTFQYVRINRARLDAMGVTSTSTSTPTPMNDDVDYKTKLIQFYEKHNPSKLDTVDATLEKYKGKEDELFQKLEAKYAPKPTTPAFPPPSGDGPRCYLEFTVGNDAPFRVVVKLYKDKAPLAAENFRCLCTGEVTTHKVAGKPLRYLRSKIHRIVPGFCIQGGDFTTGNGRGGASIYAPNSEHGDAWGKFQDEPLGFLDHSKKGLLSMANSGKNTNSSQFFFTLKAVPYLNGKHVVFGEVEAGMESLEKMSKVETNKAQKPMVDVVISACGEMDASGKDVPSLGSGESSKSPAPAFGIPAGKTPMFGGGSSSAFGTTPTPFGKPSSSPFGGSSSAIGSSTKTSTGASPFSAFSTKPSSGGGIFGSATGGFGSSSGSKPAFGAPKASSGPVFGSPSALGGNSSGTAKTTAPVFGSPSKLGSSGTAPAFGSGTTPAFGSSGGFGALAASAPKTSAPVFGSSTFGTTGSTNASGGFGSLAASAKESAPAFGNSKPSVFGSTPSAFGSNSGTSTTEFSFGGSK